MLKIIRGAMSSASGGCGDCCDEDHDHDHAHDHDDCNSDHSHGSSDDKCSHNHHHGHGHKHDDDDEEINYKCAEAVAEQLATLPQKIQNSFPSFEGHAFYEVSIW